MTPHKISRSPKQTPQVRLLNSLTNALSDAKAIQGVCQDDPSLHLLADSILSTLENLDVEELDAHTRGQLVITGDARIISLVVDEKRPLVLDGHQWRRFLKVVDPDMVGGLISRGHLHPGGMVAHILARSAADNSLWGQLLPLATEFSTAPDTTVLSVHLRGLISHPRIARHAAAHLRDQVAKFPQRYSEIARCHLSQCHLYRPLLIQQAGLCKTTLTSNPPWPDCPARALFRELQTSNHARLELMKFTHSLEETIQNHRQLHAFLHARLVPRRS